ncbi:hypothetical protein VMCG_00267 [Cytospora schulzeri]|uniref:Amidohydrolase-related domain-containing protein n=1 Tax=Cytospora schulzeri TaxID=448051 RepID=A0A423X8I1_9PEZI|nr:hypothetical protein VMCG_00267 [Valsa malicola]
MESDLRGLLQVAPEKPSTSNINNVLSIQPLPQEAPVANDYMNDDDDLEMAGNNEYDEELEVSDADSDDFRVQADIAKLNADVEAFKASMAADSSDDDDDLIDPRLAMASGLPRKRKAKKPKVAGPAKRRVGGGARSNIAELSADIKLQLSRASQAWVVENRRDEALEIVLEIIRVNAETHEAWILLSSIYEEMGAMSDYIMAKCFAAHLRPRDFHGWISCALAALADVTPGQRETNLGIAQLCYSAAIRANPKSLKARVGKANCALEAGNANVAAAEYAKVLKRRPYNMGILRNMAEAAFDTRNARKYVELARGFYEQTITYMRNGGQMEFEWSDVIIYIEMCAFMEMYAEAALALREEPEYQHDRYPYGMYGPALPLDLRAKLAIYRLKLEQDEEATRHLQWLNPQDADIYEFFVDTPFVIKDLANQLFESRRVTTALEFYDLYRRLTGEPDPEILVQQGKCYLEMEDQATAEECFIAAIEIDDDNIDARYELAQMYETAQEQEEAFLLVNEALKLEQEQRLEEGEEGEDGKDTMADKARNKRRVRQKVLREKAKARPKRARRVYVRRMANKQQREKYEESVTNNFKEKYQRVLQLREQVASGDKEAEAEWMAAAQDLVDDFRSFKEFYPWDNGLAAMAERLQQNLAPEDGDTSAQPSLRRNEHRGIPFDEWLDLFLEYAISLARHQKAKEAYLVCQSARDSIVYKSSDNTFLIHVAWAACAVYAADEETCVAVARFFMRNNSAATDSYRVFSALCRVCQSPVSWYSSGPAQKYILRQIKAMDRTLLPPEIAESALGTWDHALPREEGQGPRHEALDVALLMLYGHILLTSTSYTYALNYFLRAAALDPGNPMVNLSTGIAYVHYAMKRQAENRQFIIVQGMHYMFLYYDARGASGDVVERLEANYNVARCYHLLGIYHLAADMAQPRDSKEAALFNLENASSPPPYEAAAYPKTQPPRHLRRLISFRVRVALILALSLSGLCFWKGPLGGSRPNVNLSVLEEKKFQSGLSSCAANSQLPSRVEAKDRKENPRWNSISGQNKTIILRNATLFDGESYLDEAVDITFSKGLIISVAPSASDSAAPADADTDADTEEINLSGAYVTPGLVDMHSHHLVESWPALASTSDGNEMHPDSGPLTPFVRALDSMKAYDTATRLIASGGVTSSLIIPGSTNIIGGEGWMVKNAWKPGPNGEYMKMACGENPKGVYGHTRMGNVWVLRKWLARARELVDRQEEWCEAAGVATTVGDRARLLAEKGGYPEELELESTAGLLRGQVALHNHCYEPEDMETMLRVSREFGFRVRAFHHALSAWQVPEMLKEYGENITIATFAEFALYKQEAYGASLAAGKILNDHGIPVAYKSDHVMEDTSSKYLLLQSAVGHSFGLPADKAMQAVTSVPAAALDMDHRIGYTRPGYDADIVVWDSHPLSVGATPKQVFIDGKATLDPVKVEESAAKVVTKQGGDVYRGAGKPAMRATISEDERAEFCSRSRKPGQAFVISGIRKSFLAEFPNLLHADEKTQGQAEQNITMIIENGEVTCIGGDATCKTAAMQLLLQQRRDDNEGVVSIDLQDGHLSRGLTAVTSSLGMLEISMDPGTGDGIRDTVSPKHAGDPASIGHAKYGVSLGGGEVRSKTFARARLGGVTRAVQPPMTGGGLVTGVSTGMRTGVDSTLLNGGLFREDVAMHVSLGVDSMVDEGAVSMAVERLRGLVRGGGGRKGKEMSEEDGVQNPWTLVANGSMPLVVKADSTHDIQQVILLKKDYPKVNAVILGGHEAPLFADEIAKAKIPLIFTGTRPGQDMWTKKDSPPGPPLSRSPADTLSEAGVFYAIALNTDGGPPGDPRIQSLALEASWTAKYAGLSEHDALGLVSTNVEEILGLEKSGDVVVWEGNPLQFGTPVLAFQEQGGRLVLGSCWPNEADD